MNQSPYIIGIDLGTTNSTMAYIAANSDVVEQFAIPQVIDAGVQGESFTLPSFLYFPLEQELKKKSTALQWDEERVPCIGVYAKARGAEIPARLVSSAKSWLCHSGIDRRENILPLHSEEEKISPLDAAVQILKHLREAWDHKMSHAPFVLQRIFLTVPASFDPGARQLVQEAAEKAGYPETVLLEEPQAAFYSWLQKHADSWRNELQINDHVLVVDIGGGTTDFSLISVEDQEGNMGLKRIAVGSHLLLGGDNLDFGLAYLAKQKLEEQGHFIDEWQYQALIHVCRQAKEKLFGEKAVKQVDITIMGRGTKLIGGALKTTLTQEEAQAFVLDGFLPLVSPQEHSPTEQHLGFQEVGLPYAQDARISCQLAKFLSMTTDSRSDSLLKFIVPTAVLFNGGTLKAASVRLRILELLNKWAVALKRPLVKELNGGDLDFAVSRGAAYYGLSRCGKAIRIKSGTSHSYFIGVEDSMPAIPGLPTPLKAICIVPMGMEEGSEQSLDSQEFALVLGQPVSFRFFSSLAPSLCNDAVPVIGTVIRSWQKDLHELPPIESRMDKEEGDGKTIRVKLRARVTELGVLELWCVAQDGRQWKLEFTIRDHVASK